MICIEEDVHMHKSKNINELKIFCMDECPKIPLQLFPTLLDVTRRESVLRYILGQALQNNFETSRPVVSLWFLHLTKRTIFIIVGLSYTVISPEGY